MKVLDILNERGDPQRSAKKSTETIKLTAKEQEGKDYAEANLAKLSPEEREKQQAMAKEALQKHKDAMAARATKTCKGEHDWVVAQDDHKGIVKYKCKNCTATKSEDSTG